MAPLALLLFCQLIKLNRHRNAAGPQRNKQKSAQRSSCFSWTQRGGKHSGSRCPYIIIFCRKIPRIRPQHLLRSCPSRPTLRLRLSPCFMPMAAFPRIGVRCGSTSSGGSIKRGSSVGSRRCSSANGLPRQVTIPIESLRPFSQRPTHSRLCEGRQLWLVALSCCAKIACGG